MNPSPDEINETSASVPEMAKKTGFGAWKTFFLGILIMAVNLVVSIGITLVYIILTMNGDEYEDAPAIIQGMMSDGFYLSITIIGSAIASCLLIFLLVMFKKDINVKEYLGFIWVKKKAVVFSFLIVIAYIFLSDFITRMMGSEITTEWMEYIYVSSVWPPLLWMALVVFAPIFEEMFFRGFLFKGFVQSRLGPVGTIIITSAIWTVLHLQYGIFGLTSIFIIGIIFGIVRYKTGSLWIVILMHAFYNLIATVQIALYVNGLFG